MTSSPRLDLRTAQTLVMTPQLQQAIKLLQLSNQDLCDFVTSEIENNPFLESGEGGDFAADTMVPFKQEGSAPLGAASSGDDDKKTEGEARDENTFDTYDQQGPGGGAYDPSAPHRDWAENVAEAPSLRNHLLSQIHMDFPDPAECMMAAAMVELLDDAGYLPADLDVIRAQLGVTPAFFESIITRLQRLDPLGIFARSLK